MTKLPASVLLVAASVLAGCPAAKVRTSDQVILHDAKFALAWADNIELERFDLTLSSQDKRPICIDVRSWPTTKGELVGADSAAIVDVGGKAFPSFVDLPLECRGSSCFLFVPPYGRLQGFINYSEFPGLTLTHEQGKKLAFNPMLWAGAACVRPMNPRKAGKNRPM